MARPFLDTNVIVRHLTQDDPVQSPRATALFERLARGEATVHLVGTVIFETVIVLERDYGQAKWHIRNVLTDLLALPGLLLPEKARIQLALDLYANHRLPFGDAYHAAYMRELGLTEIISFDKHFDELPGLARVEP